MFQKLILLACQRVTIAARRLGVNSIPRTSVSKAQDPGNWQLGSYGNLVFITLFNPGELLVVGDMADQRW